MQSNSMYYTQICRFNSSSFIDDCQACAFNEKTKKCLLYVVLSEKVCLFKKLNYNFFLKFYLNKIKFFLILEA